MNAEGLRPDDVDGEGSPPASGGGDGGNGEDDVYDETTMMHLVALHMVRRHPTIVRTARMLRGEPLEDIYTQEEMTRFDDLFITFGLFVMLIIGLYVANG